MGQVEDSSPTERSVAQKAGRSGRYWAVAAVSLVLGGYGSYWLFVRSLTLSLSTSGANGIILGVWGLIISVAGFALTLWQLRRTKTATESVQRAVSGILRRVQTSDSSVEAGRLIKFLETAIVHIGHASWANAAHSLWEGQTLLTRLQGDLYLAEENLSLAKKGGDDLLNYIQLLDDLAEKQAKSHNTAPMVRSIRVLINLLDQAIISSKKELYNA